MGITFVFLFWILFIFPVTKFVLHKRGTFLWLHPHYIGSLVWLINPKCSASFRKYDLIPWSLRKSFKSLACWCTTWRGNILLKLNPNVKDILGYSRFCFFLSREKFWDWIVWKSLKKEIIYFMQIGVCRRPTCTLCLICKFLSFTPRSLSEIRIGWTSNIIKDPK